jgi:hypothetical protein
MRRLERPDPLREPGFEGEIVRKPAEQRLAEMDVSLDESGKNDETRTVDDGGF